VRVRAKSSSAARSNFFIIHVITLESGLIDEIRTREVIDELVGE